MKAPESLIPTVTMPEPIPITNFVDHPEHYTQSPMECITALEGLELPFHDAQVLKYIVRWRFKDGVEDLKKARWYLERLISNAECESE